LIFLTTFYGYRYVAGHWLFAVAILFLFFSSNNLKAQTSQTVTNGNPTTAITFPGTGCVYNWVNNTPSIGLAASGTGNIASFKAINNGITSVTATITAIPVNNGYAYIANSGSDNVSVINTLTHTVAATIPIANQPWATAIAPDGKHAYVVSTNNDRGRSATGTLSVIDATTNTVTATVDLGRNALAITVTPDGTKAYVTNRTSNTVSVIDLITNTFISDIQIPSPLGVDISPDGKKLYVTADGRTEGTLYVLNTANNQQIATVPIGLNAAGIVASPDDNTVYVANDYLNTVSVINTITYTTTAIIPVGNTPYGIDISPDGSKVYVANSGAHSISIINTATNTSTELPIPGRPFGISVSPNGDEVYANCLDPDITVAINTITNAVSTIGVGTSPVSIGKFVSAGIGCSSSPITFTITVDPPPNIMVTGTLSPMLATYGKASVSEIVSVTGSNITGGVLVTAPVGFEVSADNVTFGTTITVGATGNIEPVQVYIRSGAITTAGAHSGNIVLSSAGATSVNLSVSSEVTPVILTITADDKSKFIGDPNPVFTVKYSGFVNNEGPAVLTQQPVASTTAITTSPLGKYPITVTGAMATNYTIIYADGVLDVISGAINAPNAFTPNGDGVNDTWDIKFLDLYANCTVEVLNRYGGSVFYSVGYPIAWNGKRNGTDMPSGAYYYVIKLNNGTKPITGYVAVIR
jgi:gliding motility-associated-like protein